MFIPQVIETDEETGITSTKLKPLMEKGVAYRYYKPRELVKGYRELVSISNTGTQVIDTGVQSSSSLKCEFSFKYYVYNNELRTIVGSNTISFNAAGGYATFNYNGDSVKANNLSNYNVDKEATFGNCYFSVGNYSWSADDTVEFVIDDEDTLKVLPYAKNVAINYLKIYDGETLIRNYVPVERVSDGIVGLYDTVFNRFDFNINDDTNFTAGNYAGTQRTTADDEWTSKVAGAAYYAFNRSNVYYKYVIKEEPLTLETWEQPILTSDTSYGTLTGGGYSTSWDDRDYYHISDGVFPSKDNDGEGTWGTNNSSEGWWNWKLPEKIVIYGIKVYARYHASTQADYYLSGARFYTDSTKTTAIGEEFSITTSAGTYELTQIPSTGIVTDNIYFYKSGLAYSGIGELVITAKKYDESYTQMKIIDDNYALLTSISSTGASIDTEYYPNDTTKIKAKYVYTKQAGGCLIGQANNEADCFRYFVAGSSTYLDYGSGNNYNRINTSYITSKTDIYETEFGNRYIKDLTTDTVKISASTVSFDTKNYTVKVFSNSDYGSIYYLQIYDDDTLVRDYIPVERLSDGVIGLYDKVNGYFHTITGLTSGGYDLEISTKEVAYLEKTDETDDWDFYIDPHGKRVNK